MNDAVTRGGNMPRFFLGEFWNAVGGEARAPDQVRFIGTGALPSVFAVTDFAAASMAAAGLATATLVDSLHAGHQTGMGRGVSIDRRLASFWFGLSVRPQGWALPPIWDAVAGDYRARDGWIRLHTNAPHHRAAALAALRVAPDREAVAQAVSQWQAQDLETAVVAGGGCAGAMHSWQQWQHHPQGRAVLAEPLLHWQTGSTVAASADWGADPRRPLAGIRVLDMTRVLAGPVATRFLASLGAEVLRIDPPDWNEAVLEPEVTLGKRCARLDLREASGRRQWEDLLRGADVLVHGYRSDALERLGLDAEVRQQLRPGLVDVSLDAYGCTGPWKARRGFDSIVQMSMGFAEQGQRSAGAAVPVPLPVQALDHATGYLMACAALRALQRRASEGTGSTVRASLARTGALLMAAGASAQTDFQALAPESPADWDDTPETTPWGTARRIRWPVQIGGVATFWDTPPCALGSSPAQWARH